MGGSQIPAQGLLEKSGLKAGGDKGAAFRAFRQQGVPAQGVPAQGVPARCAVLAALGRPETASATRASRIVTFYCNLGHWPDSESRN